MKYNDLTPRIKMKIKVIILGYFQCPFLTEKQIKCLADLQSTVDQVAIWIREAPVPCTKRQPFSGKQRTEMFAEFFPSFETRLLSDQKQAKKWSEMLDAEIAQNRGEAHLKLYAEPQIGLRDYVGNEVFGILETDFSETDFSHISEAQEIGLKSVSSSVAFRLGILNALKRRYPTAFATVDVAIFRGNEILVGQKPDETKWRFLGGFVDPTDANHEAAAIREAFEESGVTVEIQKRIGSCRIDDWRYRYEEDQIISTLFQAQYVAGEATPTDDIARLEWKLFSSLTVEDLVPDHQGLFKMLAESL